MKNKIFEVGDRVYDATFGWGIVAAINKTTLLPITVKFERDKMFYTIDGKTYPTAIKPILSFTEYGFDNRFTQERLINNGDYIDKWGKFWNNKDKEDFVIKKLYTFFNKPALRFCCKINDNFIWFDNFKPLTDKQIKNLGLE